MCWLHLSCVAARILITNPILSCKIMIQIISFIRKQLLRELVRLLREFLKHFWIISVQDTVHTLNGFTAFAYSTLASVQENTMTSFNTNSPFWYVMIWLQDTFAMIKHCSLVILSLQYILSELQRELQNQL